MFKELLQGMVIGIANIIPGVSGGTMMVSMGIYDRLIWSITHLFSDWRRSLRFLLPIFAGAGLALVLLARLFEFLLGNYPIPTNFCFCGLIAGSLPFIFKKVQHKGFSKAMGIACIVMFALVVGMALLPGQSSHEANVGFSLINVFLLFGVGVITAATMVVPGVSGSMMLMLLGYYEPLLHLINDCVSSLVHFHMGAFMGDLGSLIPLGIGFIVGVFGIAKLIEWVMHRWETETYWAVIGLITASPVAILVRMDWSHFSIVSLLAGILTFGLGWLAASKLGGD